MEDARRSRNREMMPCVAELIDAHVAAFGNNFTLLRCIDYTTRNRSTRNGHKPYPFPDEVKGSPTITDSQEAGQ